MTVLFLTRLFYPHIGGVETHVLEVSRELSLLGYKIVVITEQHQKSLREKDILDNIEIYRIPVGKNGALKKFWIWRWFFKHQDLIKKADIVHAHDVFFWHLPFRFLYPKKCVFTTFHGYETRFPPSKKAILIRKLSERLSFGNICVGDYIQKWYGTKPNYVTYGGAKIIQNFPRSGISLRETKLKILFIGRLEEDTGLPIYLKALSLLREKGVDFKFEACGDGPLRELAEKQGRVCGFVSDLPAYLAGSDIVFSSSYLSILAALTAKRPVFAVYQNPLKEDYLKMAPFARWIMIEKNPHAIVRKIEHYLNHPEEEKEMVEAAYSWAKNQTWGKVSDLYLKLWKL